jgi:hypothetical protein
MIYQREARGADRAITDAIDTHVQAEQANDDNDDGSAGVLGPVGQWHVSGTEDQQPPRNDQDSGQQPSPDLRLHRGAGDENRTRTISLGIRPIRPARAADQASRATWSSRD